MTTKPRVKRIWKTHELAGIIGDALRHGKALEHARWLRRVKMAGADEWDEEAQDAKRSLIERGVDEYTVNMLLPDPIEDTS